MAVSIQIQNLAKRFGATTALDHVDLQIEPGELFFLLGPSGCGKTTLLRHIAGFYEPEEGRILIGGEDVTRVPPHKRDTGMVFQSYALWPHMTLAENVAFGLRMRGVGKSEAADRVRRALAAVKMEDMRGIRAMEIIMRHAGVTGMIAGQSEDVTSEGQDPREDIVRYIHEHKTADLLEAAVEAGLALAGAEENVIDAGREYALHLGLAFQMTDDLLDVTGSADRMGKSTGKDQEQNKMTWVALRGVEGTAEDARREISLAKEALEGIPGDTALFAAFADSLLGRAQ